MKIIPKGSTFCSEGGITLTGEEWNIIIHALIDEMERVVRGRGAQYGSTDIDGLGMLIVRLQEYRKQRGH